jgi:hypothetical protein
MVVIALAWIVSLVGVVVVARGTQQPPVKVVPPNAMGDIVSGDAIGFRISPAQSQKGVVSGTWVVKVNGLWVPAFSSPTVRPGGGN